MEFYDPFGAMMAWEEGLLSEEDEIELFQHLVRTGMAWTLQGCYGRRAVTLMQDGLIVP